MRPRVATTAVLLLPLAAGLAACGGASDNGVAAKSPDAIVAAATNAVSGVKSVHVSGSVTSGGTALSLDLNLVAGRGGVGQMSEGGLSLRIVDVNQVIYINASDAFWRHFVGTAGAQLLHGKWLKASATGQFATFASLTDLQALFTKLLGSHGALSKGGKSTVAGQSVVAVNDTTNGGTLYVATTGKPYPVEIAKTGGSGDHLVFDRYNESVSLTAPANAIDVSQLHP